METMEPEKVKATVLVCHDSKSGGIKAHVVKSKSVGDTWIAGRIIKDLEDFDMENAPSRLNATRNQQLWTYNGLWAIKGEGRQYQSIARLGIHNQMGKWKTLLKEFKRELGP